MATRRLDMKNIRKAIKERWPIPAAKRGPLIKRLIEVANNRTDKRASIHAVRALLEADRLNLEELKHLEGSTLHLTGAGGQPLLDIEAQRQYLASVGDVNALLEAEARARAALGGDEPGGNGQPA
jgi:hypothetical protein